MAAVAASSPQAKESTHMESGKGAAAEARAGLIMRGALVTRSVDNPAPRTLPPDGGRQRDQEPLLLRRVGGTRRLQRIVAVVDLSARSERTRALATGLARSAEALLDLVFVVDGFAEIFARHNQALTDNTDRFLASVRMALELQTRHARAQAVRCIGTMLMGHPALELPRHALRTDADLLMIPSGHEACASLRQEREWRPYTLGPTRGA
jgi:hypothetical protein